MIVNENTFCIASENVCQKIVVGNHDIFSGLKMHTKFR